MPLGHPAQRKLCLADILLRPSSIALPEVITLSCLRLSVDQGSLCPNKQPPLIKVRSLALSTNRPEVPSPPSCSNPGPLQVTYLSCSSVGYSRGLVVSPAGGHCTRHCVRAWSNTGFNVDLSCLFFFLPCAQPVRNSLWLLYLRYGCGPWQPSMRTLYWRCRWLPLHKTPTSFAVPPLIAILAVLIHRFLFLALLMPQSLQLSF